jgi:hypothetical protein
MAAMTLCIALGGRSQAAPAIPPAGCGRLVAATAVLVLAGWAVPRLFAVPGLAFQSDHQTTPQRREQADAGDASAALGAVCLVLSVVALRPTRAALARPRHRGGRARRMSPPSRGVRGARAGHARRRDSARTGAHHHGTRRSRTPSVPAGSGLHGSHFVVAVTPQPHQSVFGVALMVSLALVSSTGRSRTCRRSEPAAAMALRGLEGGLA